MGIFKRKKKKPEVWWNDQVFERFYKEIKPKTLVTKDRCFAVYQWANYAKHFDGDFAEVGVYKGGTARLVSQSCPDKTFHLFDTFGGMPEVNKDVDVHHEGDFEDTSLEGVKQFIGSNSSVHYYQGRFPETTSGLSAEKFSYVHIDVDIYQSNLDCMEYFYPKMITGGIMIFDDYEWKDCPGVKKSINEFLKDKKEVPVISALYQCIIIKQ